MPDFQITGRVSLSVIDCGKDDGAKLCVDIHLGKALVHSTIFDVTPTELMHTGEDYAAAWYNAPTWLMDFGLSRERAWVVVREAMEEDHYARNVLQKYLQHTEGVRTGRWSTPQP